MANRLYSVFPTIAGDYFKVYIDDADFGGSAVEVQLAAGGFKLSYDGDSTDMFNPILPSKLSVTIAVEDGTQTEIEQLATDILTAGETRFTIKVMYNSGIPMASDSLYWCGYVLPDLSGFEDLVPPYGFTLTATDGLGRLKSVDYKNTVTDYPVGVDTILNHVLDALDRKSVV